MKLSIEIVDQVTILVVYTVASYIYLTICQSMDDYRQWSVEALSRLQVEVGL